MSRIRVSSAVCLLGIAAVLLFSPAGDTAAEPRGGAARWWKGQLHCHSHWSDGDHYPEMVYDRYEQLGFHFVSLTDHNVLSTGKRWVSVDKAKGGQRAFDEYSERFGGGVETRERGGVLTVRLKTFAEMRKLLEERGRFCLLQGEEITNRRAHVNAINLQKKIGPPGGASAGETIEKSVRAARGRSTLAILNHPNWKWAVTAEDILEAPSVGFFEVYNGIRGAHSYGDKARAGTERVWDIVLAHRLTSGDGELLRGVATDDAHVYTKPEATSAIPGQGWVMVRCAKLSPTEIVKAMRAGDFYASTGVALRDFRFDGRALTVDIEPEDGVTYETIFVGTCKGCDLRGEPVTDAQGAALRATLRYGEEIGRVLATVEGASARYVLTGEELYVRAKVVSTRPKVHAHFEGETEAAWIQPVVP